MEQRDYFNGIYIAEDSDGIVYRWRIRRGELFTLPESDYGTELIDLLYLNVKKFRLAIYEIKKLCKFDVIKEDIIDVDDVNVVLIKAQEFARTILNSREVTGELLLATIAICLSSLRTTQTSSPVQMLRKTIYPVKQKNTMYCNRVFNKKGQTCKEVGSKLMS